MSLHNARVVNVCQTMGNQLVLNEENGVVGVRMV